MIDNYSKTGRHGVKLGNCMPRKRKRAVSVPRKRNCTNSQRPALCFASCSTIAPYADMYSSNKLPSQILQLKLGAISRLILCLNCSCRSLAATDLMAGCQQLQQGDDGFSCWTEPSQQLKQANRSSRISDHVDLVHAIPI